jgi:hypothetical protein
MEDHFLRRLPVDKPAALEIMLPHPRSDKKGAAGKNQNLIKNSSC